LERANRAQAPAEEDLRRQLRLARERIAVAGGETKWGRGLCRDWWKRSAAVEPEAPAQLNHVQSMAGFAPFRAFALSQSIGQCLPMIRWRALVGANSSSPQDRQINSKDFQEVCVSHRIVVGAREPHDHASLCRGRPGDEGACVGATARARCRCAPLQGA